MGQNSALYCCGLRNAVYGIVSSMVYCKDVWITDKRSIC